MELFQDSTLRLTPSYTDETKRTLYKRGGLIQFRAAFWQGGVERAHFPAVSGQAYNQALLTCVQRKSGSAAPIGEGVYALGDPDAVKGVNWASGRPGDFSGSWGAGLGPWWAGIHAIPGYECDTYDYGIHSDFNEGGSPGTLGCTGIQGRDRPGDLLRLEEFNEAWQQWQPKRYVVDHGLLTVPRPEVLLPAGVNRVKLFVNDNKVRAYRNGLEVNALRVRLDHHSGRYGVAINGIQVPLEQVLGLQLRMAYRLGGTPPRPHSLKLYAHPGKVNSFYDGQPAESLAARFELASHALSTTIAEQRLPFNQIQSLAFELAYLPK